MHLVTARSGFQVLRYGEWLPRPRLKEWESPGELLYLIADIHDPVSSEHPFGKDCWVKVSGNELKFWMHAYRRFTKLMSWLFLGADTHEVRKDPAGYYGKPFAEQLGSAIYSTVLGPEMSTKLLQDYTTHRQQFHDCLKSLDLNPMDWGHGEGSVDIIKRELSVTYDNWIRALAIASETGVVFSQYRDPKTYL